MEVAIRHKLARSGPKEVGDAANTWMGMPLRASARMREGQKSYLAKASDRIGTAFSSSFQVDGWSSGRTATQSCSPSTTGGWFFTGW